MPEADSTLGLAAVALPKDAVRAARTLLGV